MKQAQKKPNKKNPWIAALLTFLTIGLGHFYIGTASRGLLFFGMSFVLSYLAILAGSNAQLPVTLFIIISTGIFLYTYAILDTLKLIRILPDHPQKIYSRWYIYFILYLVNSTFFTPLLSTTFVDTIGKAYVISDVSMNPTLLSGDHILVDTSVDAPLIRGDVITFNSQYELNITHVKRIVGIEGDKVQLNEGHLYINDSVVQEDYLLKDGIAPDNNLQDYDPVIVPEGAYFVLGDNRSNSFDSRSFGFLESKQIDGKVKCFYWSWDSQNKQVRWKRVGQNIH